MSDETEDTAAAATDAGGEKGGKAKKGKGNLVPAAVLAVGIAVGGYFMGGSGGAATAAEPVKPPAGEIATMEPLSVNLADGHFLKVGIALQLTEEVSLEEFGEGELAKAKDLLIEQVGGRPMEELATPEGRQALKEELVDGADETFHGDVIDVYFTDFVMQ